MFGSLKDFPHLLFERVNPEKNEQRFYRVSWQPTLFDAGALVCVYGRKGGFQRIMSPQPFGSLEEAWPMLQAVVKRRIRNGYRLVGM